MRASKPLKVLYQLTGEAIVLSNKLNLPFGLQSKDLFDSNFYIRAIINDKLSINPKEIYPINTGLHILITDPHYEIVVNSYIDLLKNKGIAIFPCSYYKYGNELIVLLYNYSNNIQTINPGDKIGLLSFKEVIMVDAENIDEVYKNDNIYILESLLKKSDHLFNSKDHTWIQKEKINLNKVTLPIKLAAEINSKRIIRESCYLCENETDDNKTNIYVKKGDVVIVKKIKNEDWRKVITINNESGWVRYNKLESMEFSITQEENIDSLVEKRLK